MGKVVMILALVLGIWLATEYFAGSSPFQDSSGGEPTSVISKSGAKVEAAFEEGAKRRESLLGD